MSQDYWDYKHNRHHENTNQDGLDPDLELPFIFSPDHKYVKNGFIKKILIPYQHILFFLAMPLVYILIVYQSYKYVIKTRRATNWYEGTLMTLNVFLIFFLLIYAQ